MSLRSCGASRRPARCGRRTELCTRVARPWARLSDGCRACASRWRRAVAWAGYPPRGGSSSGRQIVRVRRSASPLAPLAYFRLVVCLCDCVSCMWSPAQVVCRHVCRVRRDRGVADAVAMAVACRVCACRLGSCGGACPRVWLCAVACAWACATACGRVGPGGVTCRSSVVCMVLGRVCCVVFRDGEREVSGPVGRGFLFITFIILDAHQADLGFPPSTRM